MKWEEKNMGKEETQILRIKKEKEKEGEEEE